MAWDSEAMAKRFASTSERGRLRRIDCDRKIQNGASRSDYERWADEAEADYLFGLRFDNQGRTTTPEKMLEWLDFDQNGLTITAHDRAFVISEIEKRKANWRGIAEREIADRKAAGQKP